MQLKNLKNPQGTTLAQRFHVPQGFQRVQTQEGTFQHYLQHLPLKPDGTKVRYHNGQAKDDAAYHAVVDYDLGRENLQQCADGVMRLRAEYLYANGQADAISFHFVSGFKANFSTWSTGKGIKVSGNQVSWVPNRKNDDSYASFQRYLSVVYAYANTYSLEDELTPIDNADMQIGDVFIQGGFPGHAIIVVDMAHNPATGEKLYMLAQSYMPAQDIQILRSPGALEGYKNNPWYSLSDGGVATPEWTFQSNALHTW
ncbi:DUF4846 domain-containing protein [Paenibacillus swuensis]|uniref:DUF4846 domain-containing protein n=1 Tax=Paenibacillus swuensis TaxID=1178515 RepID=UPI0018D32890|nr:DUF4846 domain-containing protein [Paenibacillus swuensis]